MKPQSDNYKKNRITNALLSIIGFIIIILSLLYSYFQLSKTKDELEQTRKSIDSLSVINDSLKSSVENLKVTQISILDFLVSVTGEQNVHILNSSVKWNEIQSEILNLPAGKRKDAILFGILMAWKVIPFQMGSQNVSSGFDSPRFLQFVLSKVGIEIKQASNERLSDSMMKEFKKVDKPMPGDLVFYRGQVGSFGFILASTNNSVNVPVGIGTLQAIAPLQIMSLDYVNTPYFPLIGYYRVIYPDETE